jgi:hypothetical protein
MGMQSILMKAKVKNNNGMGKVGFSNGGGKVKFAKPKNNNAVAKPGTKINLKGTSW